ncbi:hypothetical protein GpartN1_g201.t1 [Galdieria partita]|uniref:HNH nuclease domain-containing protein n=1 Tax=Galdieria partita TaxID=83374 RepID=A0A9C7UM58_9RHOD|nr:hypothetical protein GpartN1_g201.t1 [Galdieria partita]
MLYIKIPIWRNQLYSFHFQKEVQRNGNTDYERNIFRTRLLVINFKPARKCKSYLDYPELILCCSSSVSKPSVSETEDEEGINSSSEDKVFFNYYALYDNTPVELKRSSSKSSHFDLHKLERDPNTSPNSFPTLVLNADFQPVSYYPLSLWPWYETIKAVLLDKAVVLETYEKIIRSPSMSLKLPSVVALKEFRRMTGRQPIFTRFNVFLRDDFICQYCGKRCRSADLSFDHIVPRSRGGHSCWTNVVTACFHCNFKKGSRLIEETRDMRLLKYPRRPTFYELQVKAKQLSPKISHTSWNAYLMLP